MDQIGRKKPIKIRYRLSVLFFGAVIIFGLIFYKYMKTVTLEDVLSEERPITFFTNNASVKGEEGTDENGAAEPSEGESAGEIVNPVLESEKADEAYLDDCVFIGDSITYGLSSYKIIPDSNVLASVSMSVSKVETEEISTQYGSMTILEALSESTPGKIYVMLGSNGAAYMTGAEMYQDYSAFLNKLCLACPGSKVFIISTPPVTAAKESSIEAPIKNAEIDDLNSRLLEYADKNGLYYLDMNSYLKGSDGCLSADSAEKDGMHFKKSTYDSFIEYILTHTAG